MNTGERIVSLSGLPSGSALAHLAAISTGGTGATVFTSAVRVSTSRKQVFVQRPATAIRDDVQPIRQRLLLVDKADDTGGPIEVFVTKKQTSAFCFNCGANEIIVARRDIQSAVALKKQGAVITSKRHK